MSLQILLHDEVQLLDWGESRAGGPWVKFRLNAPELLDAFRGLDTAKANKTGHILNLTVAQGDIAQLTEAPEKPEPKYGHYAAGLYRCGFFFNPRVLRALGSDAEYRKWIQRQPSAYSGKFSEYVDGEGRCIAAHVRRAGDSGTAFKPKYACVPLTDEEHRLQHSEGENALGGPEWFDLQRAKYLQAWAHQLLKETLGVESLADAAPQMVRDWAERNDLLAALPGVYRDYSRR